MPSKTVETMTTITPSKNVEATSNRARDKPSKRQIKQKTNRARNKPSE